MTTDARMTIEEMEAAYPDEWVLVVDLDPHGDPEFTFTIDFRARTIELD